MGYCWAGLTRGSIPHVGKPSRYSKRMKGYRHNADNADLIERAAKLLGLSEADVVDACIEHSLEAVVSQRLRRRVLKRDKTVAQALAALVKPRH